MTFPDAMLGNCRAGLLPTVRHDAITDAAARVIVARLLTGPHLEHLFSCGWDAAAERVTSARWIATGARGAICFAESDFRAGEVALHNHPPTGTFANREELLEPSAPDLEAAHGLAERGVGSAIVSNDLSHFHLLRAPGQARGMFAAKHWRVAVGPLSVALSYFTTTTTTRPTA